MTGNQRAIGALAAGNVKPGDIACRCVTQFALDLEVHDAFLGAKAHPGHGIDDDAQSRPAFEFI